MSSQYFEIQERTLECQHIRQFPRATANDQEEVLRLAIKQYTPLSNSNPQPGDITIVGAHANGFPKACAYATYDCNKGLTVVLQELYEPLWDELLQRAEKHGLRIRGIWITDVAWQGASGVLNEGKLGNDPSWSDHPRDLLHMINTFRSEIKRPIFGIGHSMGGQNLTALSLIHPRLFTSLILIDPVLQNAPSAKGNYMPAQASGFRRDLWPSRKAAAGSFGRSKFYQAWDKRVLEAWIKHGLRDTPTLLHPKPSSTDEAGPPVTLTTTKHQEVFTFLRPNFPSSQPGPHTLTTSNPHTHNRLTHPDIWPLDDPQTPFYRSESIATFNQLPHLRPSVLYIFGRESALSSPEAMEQKLSATGVGPGGSGGVVEGRVKDVMLENTGHLIPMEKVGETADHCAAWLGAEFGRWKEEEWREREQWARVPGKEKVMLGEEYLKHLGSVPGLPKRKAKL